MKAKAYPYLFILPFFAILAQTALGDLGANPVETISHFTGNWAVFVLLYTLALGPLRYLLPPSKLLSWLARTRRAPGLWAFFYAQLHLLIWLLDQILGGQELAKNLSKPFILWGLAADFILLILALTSLKALQRKLPWKKIHRFVWFALPLIGFHWSLKEEGDPQKALLWLGPLLLLYGLRRLKLKQNPLRRAPPARNPYPNSGRDDKNSA